MGKLAINCRPVIPSEDIARNIEHARSLGLPFAQEAKRPPLAVLGGGHSINSVLEEVKAFQGDRWIIGSAFRWWHSQGVDGRFFSVHPSAAALKNITGVKKALVCTTTHPEVLAKLNDVELFDLPINGGTSATAVPMLAIQLGYREVTFYGCDSSYHGSTHAYMSVNDPFMMKVECGGEHFLTGAEFLMQAEYLSAMIRAAPHVFSELSGGLLSAMVKHGDYNVLEISEALNNSIIEHAA
jgi:hypothetical protein